MLKEKEDTLFNSWKQEISAGSGAVFVTDGVVNETAWFAAPRRVLYLMKEVNEGDREWDERDYLDKYNIDPSYQKTHSPTVDALCRWQYGITENPHATWQETEEKALQPEIQTRLLSQICLVNIKKTAGGALVDWAKFEQYFKNPVNRDNLKKQLDLYQPDIVICGNTAYWLCKLKNWNGEDWSQTRSGIRYRREAGTVYLDFCHPNNRGPKNMICFSLWEALKEIGI